PLPIHDGLYIERRDRAERFAAQRGEHVFIEVSPDVHGNLPGWHDLLGVVTLAKLFHRRIRSEPQTLTALAPSRIVTSRHLTRQLIPFLSRCFQAQVWIAPKCHPAIRAVEPIPIEP